MLLDQRYMLLGSYTIKFNNCLFYNYWNTSFENVPNICLVGKDRDVSVVLLCVCVGGWGYTEKTHLSELGIINHLMCRRQGLNSGRRVRGQLQLDSSLTESKELCLR